MIEHEHLRPRHLRRAARSEGVEAEANAWLASVTAAFAALTWAWLSGLVLALLALPWNVLVALPFGLLAWISFRRSGQVSYRLLQVACAERKLRKAYEREGGAKVTPIERMRRTE